jgi:hypothetical protein
MTRRLLLALVFALPAVGVADDKPRPRAKLLGTVKLATAVSEVCWTADAKHLVLITTDKGLIVPRDQLGEDAPAKPVGEFTAPAGAVGKYGVTPDGGELFAVVAPGGRFNAEARLCYWNLKDLLDGKKKAKPDRVVTLDADNPTAFAVAADGKTVYAVVSAPRAGGMVLPSGLQQHDGQVLTLDAKTGDAVGEAVPLAEADGTLVGATVHPASGRVFAHFQLADEHVVRGIDLATKKIKWERKFDAAPPNQSGVPPKGTPDGKAVVAVCSKQTQSPVPGQQGIMATSPHLLNAGTGEVIAELGGDDVYLSDITAFSDDGKLAFGWLSRANGLQQVLWDARTGKPLKTWARGVSVQSAAFAPGKHELATVERGDVQVVMPNPPGDPTLVSPFNRGIVNDLRFDFFQPVQVQQVQQVVKTEPTSVVGVWDLAPLVK